MNQSYLAIVTPHGLQAIFRESDQVWRSIRRRIYHDRRPSELCCWAVMPDELMQQIELQISDGESEEALQALQEYAAFLGPILPSSDIPEAR
jgi:hypothetical protein